MKYICRSAQSTERNFWTEMVNLGNNLKRYLKHSELFKIYIVLISSTNYRVLILKLLRFLITVLKVFALRTGVNEQEIHWKNTVGSTLKTLFTLPLYRRTIELGQLSENKMVFIEMRWVEMKDGKSFFFTGPLGKFFLLIVSSSFGRLIVSPEIMGRVTFNVFRYGT